MPPHSLDLDLKFAATTQPGLEKLLANELRQMGGEQIRVYGSSVRFQGELQIGYRACLWSRIANRILLPITDISSRTADALYNDAKNIRWERHLYSNGSFAIDVAGSSSHIKHSRFAVQRLKDAIVDRFRDKFNERPSVDTEQPDIRIHLFLRGDSARLSIDLSGGGLHRRGYRQAGAMAPMKENLAAGLLLFAGWPELVKQDYSLYDPMCGSGTLLIEAAMMAADIAPGTNRGYYGLLGWKRHDAAIWQSLIDEADIRRDNGLQHLPQIIGHDSDTNALAAAADNIRAAGLEEHIQLKHQDFGSGPLPDISQHGLLITNPPYGERLGDVEQLRNLYARLGNGIREELAIWRAAIFSGNAELDAVIGLKPTATHALDNGGLPCRLLVFNEAGGHQQSAMAETTELSPSAEAFANRIRKNLKQLGRWASRNHVNCYRLYDRDIPEYALAVDLYHSGTMRLAHVQEYQAPSRIDAAKAQQRLDEALYLLPQLLEIPTEQMFFKLRHKQKSGKSYQRQSQSGRYFEVIEAGTKLLVNLSDYLDSGLFLDHRPLRVRLQQSARNKRFLNLFCYTATASVHAAIGGAKSSVSVDLSPGYIEWAGRNFKRNKISTQQHKLIQQDVMHWLKQAQREKTRYDLILLDPPTLSKSKRMQGDFNVQRDQVFLVDACMKILAKDGELYFSNNFRKFKLDPAISQRYQVEDISASTIDEDFKRNTHIHKCWRITRAG